MEQTNLVVTPDGKTWDQVTRDVSYIGNASLRAGLDSGDIGSSTMIAHDSWRGGIGGVQWMNKDFAIAYDMIICLRNGDYVLYSNAQTSGAGTAGRIDIYQNGVTVISTATTDPESGRSGSMPTMISMTLVRGDYVQIQGINIEGGTGSNSNHYGYAFHITRSD